MEKVTGRRQKLWIGVYGNDSRWETSARETIDDFAKKEGLSIQTVALKTGQESEACDGEPIDVVVMSGETFSKLACPGQLYRQPSQRIPFSLIGGGGAVYTPEDILYFERIGRKTNIVTIWGTDSTWEKLSDIENRIKSLGFVRCHNSYIIYLPAVKRLNAENALIQNGHMVAVSRSYKKQVKEAFSKWMKTLK